MTAPHPRYWRSAAEALAALRREPGLTRAELGRRLGLDSGPTSDLVKRLTGARLITEQRTAPAGRGRPTTTVHASPTGPVAVVVDVRHADWRIGTCAVDGVVDVCETGPHDGRPDGLLDVLHKRIRQVVRPLGPRLIGIGVAVPGPAADDRVVNATMLGWRDVDITRVARDLDVALVVGNDATMAAVAESRLHTPRPNTLVHIVVEVGIGGALVVEGRPMASARGLQGEFGHLPLGNPKALCPCGARGCWTVSFDIPQVAEAIGATPPTAARDWLHDLFTDASPAAKVRHVREALAADLGRGIAGLINALDPDLVTLGGLAADLRSAAPQGFERAVNSGLMSVHRDRPPAVIDARGGEDAALIGIGLSVFDRVLDAEMLVRWTARTVVRA